MRAEFMHFTMAEYSIENALIDTPFDIVLLSDLHGNVYGEEQKELVKLIGYIRPALILCPGDFISRSDPASQDTAYDFLCRLERLAPTFFINGNHEQKLAEEQGYVNASSYESRLKKAPFHFLKNSREILTVGENDLDIAGYEMFLSRYKKLRENQMTLSEMEKKLGEASKAHFQILLAHDPTFIDHYFEWGASLVVCGHYHGGIMRLYGNQVLISPTGKPLPKYGYGLYEKDGRYAVVTSGLGDHRYAVRIANPKELVLIHVRKKSGYHS